MRTCRTATVAALALLALLVGPADALAGAIPMKGPVYPLSGGPGTGHGGNVCVATNATPGSASGVTWKFGSGYTAPTVTTCPYGTSTPALFDISRFDKLYWGLNPTTGKTPRVSMDGASYQTSEILSFLPAASDPAGGKLVWGDGGTKMYYADWSTSPTVYTRLQLTITNITGSAPVPVPLLTPTQAGIPGATETGGVVAVTSGLRRFAVNIKLLASFDKNAWQPADTLYNTYTHPDPAVYGRLYNSSFNGAFWYLDRPPVVSFTFDPPIALVPLTFTATMRDPDGTIASFGWDFNNDNVFTESNKAVDQWAFTAGRHTVGLKAVDDEGSSTTVTRSFDAPIVDADSDGYPLPADCSDHDPGVHPNAPEILDNDVDENCNGIKEQNLDRDRDGYDRPLDCNDENPAVHPGAIDAPGNGVDENCDGVPAEWTRMNVVASWNHSVKGSVTVLSNVRLRQVPKGAEIAVKCKSGSKGCPKAFTLKAKTSRVALKRLGGRRLRAGTSIEIRVTKSGYMGWARLIKIRKSKPPLAVPRCLPPGTTKLVVCGP